MRRTGACLTRQRVHNDNASPTMIPPETDARIAIGTNRHAQMYDSEQNFWLEPQLTRNHTLMDVPSKVTLGDQD